MHPRPLLVPVQTCLVLLVAAAVLHAAAPASAAATSCAPRTCGNLTIAYPFWMPADTTTSGNSSSSAPCGPTAFQVDCSRDGRASLARSFRGGYKILRVSYADRTLIVANDNVQTDARGCPVPRVDVSASLSLAPFTASAANAQLVFLHNCSTSSSSSPPPPPPPGFVDVTSCPGTHAVVRLDPVYNATDAAAVAGTCVYSVVPVLPGASATNAATDYPRLLRGGYLLEWRASASGNCTACSASGGRCAYDSDTDAFACVCADGSTRPARCDAKKSGKKKVVLIVAPLVSFGVLLAFLMVVIFKFRRQMHGFSLFSIMDGGRSTGTANVEKILKKYGPLAPKRYGYSELKSMTKSFAHKLGEGGYGTVYSGVLNGDDGQQRAVAVKVLRNSSQPNGAEEFLNEVVSIGRTSHVNVVTLLGFCLEKGTTRRALVYEYMTNGSLDRYIYSNSDAAAAALGWDALHEIAVGVARGLEYLHEGCNTRIIHFDIKPHNVLLDRDMRPKIADFGMAKLCSPEQSILSMADARGTVGFIAPEVFSRGFGVVSTKSDVYSYGMLLLEMVAGSSNAKAYAEDSSNDDLFFPLWVYDRMMLDNDAGVLTTQDGGGGEEVARKMALIGLWCIQTVPASRPSMSRVLEMLERSVHELAMPPRPYHASPSSSPSPSRYPSSYPSTATASDYTQRSRFGTPESTV